MFRIRILHDLLFTLRNTLCDMVIILYYTLEKNVFHNWIWKKIIKIIKNLKKFYYKEESLTYKNYY